MNLYLLSKHGTKLTDEVCIFLYIYIFALIGIEMASFPWYKIRSKTIKKYMVLIILKSQHRVGVRVGPFSILTFDNYTNVIKFSYNYLGMFNALFFHLWIQRHSDYFLTDIDVYKHLNKIYFPIQKPNNYWNRNRKWVC